MIKRVTFEISLSHKTIRYRKHRSEHHTPSTVHENQPLRTLRWSQELVATAIQGLLQLSLRFFATSILALLFKILIAFKGAKYSVDPISSLSASSAYPSLHPTMEVQHNLLLPSWHCAPSIIKVQYSVHQDLCSCCTVLWAGKFCGIMANAIFARNENHACRNDLAGIE